MKYLLDKDQNEFRDVIAYIELNKDNRKADKTKEPLRLDAMFCKHDLDIDLTVVKMNDNKMTIEKLIEYNLKYHDLKFVPEIKKIELQDENYRVVATAYYSESKFLSYLEKHEYFEKLNYLGQKMILNVLQLDDRDIGIYSDGVYELTRGRNEYDAHLIGDVISRKRVMPIKQFVSLLEYVKRNINDYE